MKDKVLVSLDGNITFNEDTLKEAITLLDEGKTIWIGISCLGHGHNNACQEDCKRILEKHYGDKLKYSCFGYCSYSYTYWLEEVK